VAAITEFATGGPKWTARIASAAGGRRQRTGQRQGSRRALASSGRTNQQIAAELGISRNAVRYHLKELHSKLETGGQREELRAPRWRRLIGSFFALHLGKAGAAMSFGIVGGTLALAAVGAYIAYPGATSQAQSPAAVDGFYPNGCADHLNPSGTTNLDEFAAMLRADPGTLRALNPALDLDHFTQDMEIAVPYQPDATCSQATATPPGSTRQAGGTPTAPTRPRPQATPAAAGTPRP
jgi:hypothetical protein